MERRKRRDGYPWYSLMFAVMVSAIVASCSVKKDALLLTGGDLLVVASGMANHLALAYYDLNSDAMVGRYVQDLRAEADIPRGLASFDPLSFLVSADGGDVIYKIGFDGSKSLFHGTAALAGNLYDMVTGPLGLHYVIETNNVEVFDSQGTRLTNTIVTGGACTFNTPRTMAVTESGELLVTNTGGSGALLFFDITDQIATCVRSVNIGNTPIGVLAHSNGHIYVATQANDVIVQLDADGSNSTTIWTTNLTLINNPVALAEHPSGDILVASSGTNTIERITVDGERVGTVPFIRDALSIGVSDMMVIRRETGDE